MALAVRTDWAFAFPRIASLLLLWVTADALTLGLLAHCRRPAPRQVLATVAGGMTLAWTLSPPALRDAMLTMPWFCAMMLVVVGTHAGLRCWRAGMIVRRTGLRRADGWHALLGEFLPPPAVRLMLAEARLVHLALFRWNGPADIPPGACGFAYHRHLQPMMIALLVLSLIEAGVTHLLVAHWSRTAALILFVVSDVSVVYLIGLIKSLRLRPVLLTADGVRIRAGLMIDRFIPYDRIAAIEHQPDSATIKAADTQNAALIAWPNLVLRLTEPMPRPPLLRRRPPIVAIAFRLDDPDEFVQMLRWRTGVGT
ncbi:hypothetical protein GCM10022268_35370 [Sphingomonas cynarae]|uniref:Uncharacterized protein n=2 Tax=Sphingomonas cynarae TaxID=930197 RepID=A0ABP7EVT3_9SPHN